MPTTIQPQDNTIPVKHPQEIEVWYVLPIIRKELVLALKKQNHSQKEIATLLNLTPSAVSQYCNAKRAKDISLPEDVKEFITKAAANIKDTKTAYQQIQKISDYIKTSKAICRIHMDVETGLSSCDICYK